MVSIVVPMLNSADDMPNVVRFLGEQLFRDFEVIFVVDSKSTDGTEEAVEKFAPPLGTWSMIIQHSDGGLGEARNLGIDASRGRYVWFFDADDRPHTTFLSTLVTLAEENGADLAQCNFIRSSDLGTQIPRGNYKVKIMDSDEALHNRASELVPITSWSFVFKRQFLLDNGLYFMTHRFCEDIDHTYRALEKCNKLCYYDMPLYLYHQNEESMCFLDQNSRGWGEIEAYKELDEFFERNNPEFYKLFGYRSGIMRIRSATHMDLENFLKFIRSDEFSDMVEKHLRNPVSPEGVFSRLFPRTYHLAVNLFLKFFYYRESRLFDTRPRKRWS